MKLTLTAILFCLLNLSFGQTEKEHPIDLELQNCLDSSENYTTKGMTDCVVRATEKWDEELNKNYQELLILLTAEQTDKLKIAQRKWVEYRNKRLNFQINFTTICKEQCGFQWQPKQNST
jgi:uncharacterized protein YecT (DUF1311 family)